MSSETIMQLSKRFALVALPFALVACVSLPSGPSVMVLPGTGMSFDQFRLDETTCRQYAGEQVGQSSESAGTSAGVSSAAIG